MSLKVNAREKKNLGGLDSVGSCCGAEGLGLGLLDTGLGLRLGLRLGLGLGVRLGLRLGLGLAKG